MARTNYSYITLLGVIYIFLSVLAYFNSFYYNEGKNFLWMCYIGIFIIGLGMLIKNSNLIKSQLYILLIPNIIWAIDFFSFIARGDSYWEITEYFFSDLPMLGKIVSLHHLITIPAALFVFYHLKLKKGQIWIASFLQLVVLFFATRALTSRELNINCVYKACGEFLSFIDPYYPWIWFGAALLMILFTKLVLMMMRALWKSRIEDVYSS